VIPLWLKVSVGVGLSLGLALVVMAFGKWVLPAVVALGAAWAVRNWWTKRATP